MRLARLKFVENRNSAQEWTLDSLQLDAKTLIVGKNAEGKSRTINVLASLAFNLRGQQPLSSPCEYETSFINGDDHLEYCFEFRNTVVREVLKINGTILLNRGDDGVGEIWASEIGGGTNIKFQTPPSELAVVARRDAIQHPFLQPLYEWASNLRFYRFGSQFGKERFAVFHDRAQPVDDRDPDAVSGVFHKAIADYGNNFLHAMKQDLSAVGYKIEEIGLKYPVSIVGGNVPAEMVGVFVKEEDLPGITDQITMSQGMYRVIALLIHINYLQFKKSPACLLVDDIGEGLDFDRSCRLICLLRKKAEESDLQVIMSTNDRFVMNEVPLEEWTILQRKGNHVSVRNHWNSKEIFEDFKFTGLNNFSFLELDVLNENEDADE